MHIERFDEGLQHREILPYDPRYAEVFALVRDYAKTHLPGVELVHIGSTAVPDLRGKPMVDIAALTERADLREEQQAFERAGFHRRPVWVDRDEKPYVCASLVHAGTRFNVNLHLCHRGDPVHVDSLAFIDILNRRPDLRLKYEQAKDRAHAIDPADPQVYNRAKEAAIHEIEALIPRDPQPRPQPRNPLHGMTLEAIVTALAAHYGWSELGTRIPVRCFTHDPSIASSLKFLRKTPWAREKVEGLYLFMQREAARRQR